jgi:hypothetical protein
MKISLSEVLSVLSSWESNSLPVKVVLLSPSSPGFRVIVRGTLLVDGSAISISAPGSELRLPLPEDGFDLKSSAELSEDLRDEVMDRFVRVLSGRLLDGITLILYELWAADVQITDS